MRQTTLKVAAASTVCVVGLIALARSASAQAVLPPKGEGNVAVTYQGVLAEGHLGPDGKRPSTAAGRDQFRSHVLMSDVEFGLTDRIALSFSLPFIATRYDGEVPHLLGVHGQPSTMDDGTYHGSFQDFRFGVRFNVRARPLMITTFAEGIIPSHHYESRGHSVVGQDLRVLVLGTSLARSFEPIIPRTYGQAQLSYGFVQKVAGIRPDRSRVDVEVGHRVTHRLALTFLESLKLTHDGVDFPYAGLPTELSRNHDRLSRNNTLNLGGGFTFAMSESLDVSVAMSKLVWGQNVHAHWGYGVGLNWHFQTGPALWQPRNQARRISAPKTMVPPRSARF
jgi:hypothetical protein